MAANGSYIPANVSRESWINVEIEVEQSMQSYLDSLDEELSNQPGFKKPPTKIVRKCRTTSQTDPDSGYINHGSKRGIGYLMEATVDCKYGILTGVDVYSANEKESVLILRHLERQINLGIPNEPACSGSRIRDWCCSPGAGASGHYRIYPRNSVLQST